MVGVCCQTSTLNRVSRSVCGVTVLALRATALQVITALAATLTLPIT